VRFFVHRFNHRRRKWRKEFGTFGLRLLESQTAVLKLGQPRIAATDGQWLIGGDLLIAELKSRPPVPVVFPQRSG
jgi:hypothetical protein